MAINSRTKGATFERKVAKLFEEATGVKWGRTPGSGAFATRTGMNSLQGDIFCEEDFPFLVECKAYDKIPLHLFAQCMKSCLITKWLTKLIDQCVLANKQGVLVYKENRGKLMAMYQVTTTTDDHGNYFKLNNVLFRLSTLEFFLENEIRGKVYDKK